MLAFWIVGAAGAVLFLVSLLLGDVLDGVFDSLEGATGGLLSTAAVGGFAGAFGLAGGTFMALTDFGFGWAVAGVAWATVAAEYAGLALGLWLVRRSLAAWPWPAIWRPEAFRRLLNRDMFLRSLCLEAAFVAFSALGAASAG